MPQSLLYEDNDGCRAMAIAGKPIPYTRHIDIKYHSLCGWVVHDLILLGRISTSQNMADNFTMELTRVLFHHHMDFILRHVSPSHSPHFAAQLGLLQDDNPPAVSAAKIDVTMPFPHQVYYMNA